MKYIVITILVAIAILDVLLILGCAKLEKMRGEDDEQMD